MAIRAFAEGTVTFATVMLMAGVAAAQQSAAPSGLLVQAAGANAHAAEEMLLSATQAGHGAAARWVAVGDHGTVLLSDDQGKTFRQAKSVPTRATLTSVSFADERQGWACGHWGTILHTTDGGETWLVQRSDPSTDRPLFSVSFTDARHGVAVGLWSLLLLTSDGGRSWNELKLQTPPDGGKADRNLFSIFSKGGMLFIAAERGMVLRSEDQGAHWTYVDTGYTGSFWTGTSLEDGTLLVGGLRGSLYRSNDDGMHWRVVETHTKSSITGIAQMAEGVFAVGLDGLVLKSTDNARVFTVSQRGDRMPLTSVFGAAGKPIGLSKQGVVTELLPSTGMSKSSASK